MTITVREMEAILRGFERMIDFDSPIVCDYETVSFNDDEEALRPFHGHKIGSIGLYQHNDELEPLCIPIRHVTEGKDCWDIDTVLGWYKEFSAKCKIIRGQNIKFEANYTFMEGISWDHITLQDSMTLARIVNNVEPFYNLKYLTDKYCVQYKKNGDEVNDWCKAHNTKDYGKVPLKLLLPYLRLDLLSTNELFLQLEGKLPEESRPVWEQEQRFLKKLHFMEREGLWVDKNFLMRKKIVCLQEMIKIQKELNDIIGFEINPGSDQQVGAYFNSIGIHSFEKTKGGKDGKNQQESWTKNVLKVIHDDKGVADRLVKYSLYSHISSAFCEGWLKERDEHDRIHPTFWAGGSNSGRVTSSEPNAQNYPEWFNAAVLIEPGYVGVKWDLSQIEYRIFCHYGNDPAKLKSYEDNPEIDYHQMLADDFKLPRKPIKTINFAILFGMGKAKTIRSLRKDIASFETDKDTTPDQIVALRFAMRRFAAKAYGAQAEVVVPLKGNIADDVMDKIAVAVLEEYHSKAPEIKRLNSVIKDSIYARGYVRNFFGRHAQLPYDKAYVGLNRIIQGSAADFFKWKVNQLFDDPRMPKSVKLVNNIHDAIKAKMHLQDAQMYWMLCRQIVQESPFRVPLRIDGEAALYNWGNYTKIKNDDVISALIKVSTLAKEKL